MNVYECTYVSERKDVSNLHPQPSSFHGASFYLGTTSFLTLVLGICGQYAVKS